ncbi:hypothetical protein ACWT_4520 [Actinoplanes sp. SE50]|uniref:hypothetical protein n=1 Tax=unclassified Actinoplanes TaxID=2626549 RepID=UPI00023ED0B9|nr:MULTISPECIES: hypothetical protein [unclassified Actinoplanes]AEV85542.1 hypothetical protein ACPL_4651 [Actinoplanes sp. SE50/110]ATO83935.1 hypothetical protein ACWT_4520 [Actinoplanes sp. SE50]SLM01345.1 hypothetical protein ACSP50_4581 [Actinoplanes sp. SE50/110]
MHPLADRLRAALTAGRSVTLSAGDVPLFTYSYGAAQPELRDLRTLDGAALPSAVTWTPPHAAPGAATHVAITDLSSSDDSATVAHHLRWPAFDEWRSLTASLSGAGAWTLLFENTVTNVSGRRLLLDGRSLAMPTLAAPAAAPTAWHAAHGDDFTLVAVDDAANLQHPPRWSAGLSPAPFGATGVVVGVDRTIAFRYALVIAPPGPPPDALAGLGLNALAGPSVARPHRCHGDHSRATPTRKARGRALTRRRDTH